MSTGYLAAFAALSGCMCPAEPWHGTGLAHGFALSKFKGCSVFDGVPILWGLAFGGFISGSKPGRVACGMYFCGS